MSDSRYVWMALWLFIVLILRKVPHLRNHIRNCGITHRSWGLCIFFWLLWVLHPSKRHLDPSYCREGGCVWTWTWTTTKKVHYGPVLALIVQQQTLFPWGWTKWKCCLLWKGVLTRLHSAFNPADNYRECKVLPSGPGSLCTQWDHEDEAVQRQSCPGQDWQGILGKLELEHICNSHAKSNNLQSGHFWNQGQRKNVFTEYAIHFFFCSPAKDFEWCFND